MAVFLVTDEHVNMFVCERVCGETIGLVSCELCRYGKNCPVIQ